jgi:hypothetical protein
MVAKAFWPGLRAALMWGIGLEIVRDGSRYDLRIFVWVIQNFGQGRSGLR